KAKFPHLTLLSSEENLGFAGGNNIGIKHALAQKARFVLLLNNDALIEASCLKILVEKLNQADPTVGVTAAKVYYAHDRKRIWTVGSNFRPLLPEVEDLGKGATDSGQWGEVKQIEFIPFCGVLFKAEVFEEVGLLDDRYFLYYEDMDYCQRLKAHDIKILLTPDAIIWHAVSTSSGGGHSANALYWRAKSSVLYFREYGWGWSMLLIAPFRLLSALRLTLTLMRESGFSEIKSYWAGLRDGLRGS
ncbi:MAG: glycosyltransferase family 2 protein, partial [Chloroflexota bacterium]